MTRRSSEQIAADLDQRSAKLKADADRRRSVASDATCSLQWEAEQALRRLAAYMGADGGLIYGKWVEALQSNREARWAELKARGLA